MEEMFSQYLSTDFIDALAQFWPFAVGGLLTGFCVAIFGWAWGFVVRIGKIEA